MSDIHDAKFQLEMNGAQAKLIELALEEYFRLRLGQFSDFTDSLAFQGFDYENHTDEDFNERIRHRDAINKEAERLKKAIWPPYGFGIQKSQTEVNIIDIWHVIRHELYLAAGGDPNSFVVMADTPRREGEYPLPKMRKLENQE